MKLKWILIGTCSLITILFSGCRKDTDFSELKLYQEGAKLKRILLYASLDSKQPISIVSEYEYNKNDRISKVSSPLYIKGEIKGIYEYEVYEYNSSGQLSRTKKFHANSNYPSGFLTEGNYIYYYFINGKLEKKTVETDSGYIREYFIYEYKDDLPVKITKYNDKAELESYVVNEYDNSGKLIKEASFAYDDLALNYKKHSYSGSLLTKTDVYYKDWHTIEIINTYDKNKNLIITQQNELIGFSSMGSSSVLRYEYYD